MVRTSQCLSQHKHSQSLLRDAEGKLKTLINGKTHFYQQTGFRIAMVTMIFGTVLTYVTSEVKTQNQDSPKEEIQANSK